MKNILTLERRAYTPHFTVGKLHFNGEALWTMEAPWIPDFYHGSLPFKSCVPEGTYQIMPHSSDKYPETWLFYNSALKVYPYPDDRPESLGRYVCLFHVANFASELSGCIAPGMDVGYLKRSDKNRTEYGVLSSGNGMQLLAKFLRSRKSLDLTRLIIKSYPAQFIT